MILMAAFIALLGISSYFIIDHYKEAEEQIQMYDSLAQIVEESLPSFISRTMIW